MTRIGCWILLAIATTWGCIPAARDVQCIEDANCDRFDGGACRSAPSGHHWCSYPDSECPSGYRYSDLDVGDGVSGTCTETPGQPRWVRQIGGLGSDWGNGIAVDGEGNVIAAGTFTDSLQIGDTTLTSVGSYDFFVAKLNGLTGEVIWVHHFGGLDTDFNGPVRTDASGNIYVAGYFYGTIDLGGGALQSAGNADSFVLKLTPDGDHVWSRRFGGVGSDGSGELAVRGDAVVVVGTYSQGTVFGASGPAPLAQPYTDIFILKLTTDGEFVWSRTVEGPAPSDVPGSVALDSSGNVVVVGQFGDTVDFGGGPLTTLTAMGSYDLFIAKYAGATGAHLLSRRYGGIGYDLAHSVAVDSMDNIIITGSFTGTVDFGGPISLTSNNDIFVAKYTLAGAYLWAKSFGAMSATGSGLVLPGSAVVDESGDVVMAGQFCGTLEWGGEAISSSSQCLAPYDIFAARLSGSSGDHMSSVRAGSRAQLARIALGANGGLYLIGRFDEFAELGEQALTPVKDKDAFILSLAPL